MRDAALWSSLSLAAALTAAAADGRPPPGNAGLVYPLVTGHGGVVPLPRAAEQPRKGAKAVFDITADAKPGQVTTGFEQVARLLNLYGAAGLIQLGALLLIATPVARVAFTIYAFSRRRDVFYVVVTFVGLALLLFSLFESG